MQSTLPKLVFQFLKDNPNKRFKAREIAATLIAKFPDHFAAKEKNTNLHGDALINQVSSEIGAHKKSLQKLGVFWVDHPSPRRYYYPRSNYDATSSTPKIAKVLEPEVYPSLSSVNNTSLKEFDLYPHIMNEFLSSELGLSCMRISESASKNNLGYGANKWLHPDIVAMQRLDKSWCQEVKSCLGENSTAKIKLWSFEVKKDLTTSNFRESFFQAVSNSSWANEGYLIATSISSTIVEDLRMLSSLHGIGVIILNTDNFSESEVFLPSRQRAEVDWQSINRIAEQNSNFKEFLRKVQAYLKSDYYDKASWNK